MKHYKDMQDYFEGSPVVVIGNAPSLKDVPTELFDKYPTFGVNSIYTLPYLAENPVSVYTIEGLGHLRKEEERNARMPYITKVAEAGGFSLVNRRMTHFFQHLPNIYYIDYITENGVQYNSFQFQPFEAYGTGACVTYAVLQFAYYLTSGEVLMVGMDHRFDKGNWHFYPDKDAPEFHSMQLEEYQKFRNRTDPKLREVADVYRVTGRTLLNLTPDSAATMFEPGNIEDWL